MAFLRSMTRSFRVARASFIQNIICLNNAYE